MCNRNEKLRSKGAVGWRAALGLSACVAAAALWWALWLNNTEHRLSAAIRAGPPGAVLDLAQVAPFDWDRVYFFGPYSSHDEIERQLGFRWRDVGRTNIYMSDTEVLVVFVKQGRVVEWFEHSRVEDLSNLARAQGYTREEARFRIVRDSRGSRWSLDPLP